MKAAPSAALRRFEARDAEAVAEVFRAAILGIDPEVYTPAELDAWAARGKSRDLEVRCARAFTWIAEVDGAVAGFLAAEPDGHVDLAFVHPRFQGLGLARSLHAAAEEHARRERIARLFTEASHAARPFFERAGYRVLAENRVPVADQVLTNWLMGKRLAPFAAADHVFVVGNSGSGKTTFARLLASALDRPHIDLDVVAFADQAGTRRPLADSLGRLQTQAGFTDRAVVEGCYADLVAALARPSDHLVWLDLPIAACVDNARARPWEPHKWPSADAQLAFLPRLIAFIEAYPDDPSPTGRPAHAELFQRFPGLREAHRTRPSRPEFEVQRRGLV